MDITKLYPGGKKKAFTMSYDDGVRQDIAFLYIINKYGLKCTFNLSSGRFSSSGMWTSVPTNRLSEEISKTLYCGHEIAVHSLTHPNLTKLSKEDIMKEIKEDKENLSRIAGYPVRGMAYPMGAYNDEIIECLKECGIVYARTVKSTYSFELPENLLTLHPTCKHTAENVFTLLEEFKNTDTELALFYLWGHSYEFDTDNNWYLLEDIAKKAVEVHDCWFATNIDIIDYLEAMKKLKTGEDYVKNNSSHALWLKIDKKIIRLDPNEEYKNNPMN